MNWEGIIGTAVGVVATLVATQMLKGLGKIDLFFTNWTFKAYRRVNGREIESTIFGPSDEGRYSAIIQVYNASESSKVLRDIKIVFEYDGGIICDIPYDDTTTTLVGHAYYADQLTILNLPPKQIIQAPIHGRITKNQVNHLQIFKGVYFEAYFPNGKKIRKLIAKNMPVSEEIQDTASGSPPVPSPGT